MRPCTPSRVVAAAVVIASLACGGGGGSGGDESASEVIGAGGGTVSLPSGPSLTIPAGALSSDTAITIAKSSSSAPGGALGALYEFGPAGTIFARTATVAFPVPAGTSAASIYWTAAGSSTAYESLATAIAGTSASAEVSHLSAGFVGVSCTAGDSCTPPNGCRLGAIGCGTGAPVCAETGADAADGSACAGGGTCQAGACMTVTYGAADLAGTWQMNALASGPGAPWWERGPMTVAGDGTFSGDFTQNDDSPDPVSGTLAISSAGVLTISVNGSARGCMDVDKTVALLTSTWVYDGRTTDLGLLLKPAASPSLSDLAGTWESNALATGPGVSWWERASVAVEPDGHLAGSTTESGGGSDTVSGVFSVSAEGIVTIPGRTTLRGVLDAGKTILVMTDTWSSGTPGTAELKVLVKTAGSYSTSDLAGTWEVNALASSEDAPRWERAQLSVADDGSFTGSTSDSGGGGSATSGTLVISPGGVVTLAGSSTFRGALDAGKTVVAATDTMSTGEAKLLVITRVQ